MEGSEREGGGEEERGDCVSRVSSFLFLLGSFWRELTTDADGFFLVCLYVYRGEVHFLA